MDYELDEYHWKLILLHFMDISVKRLFTNCKAYNPLLKITVQLSVAASKIHGHFVMRSFAYFFIVLFNIF